MLSNQHLVLVESPYYTAHRLLHMFRFRHVPFRSFEQKKGQHQHVALTRISSKFVCYGRKPLLGAPYQYFFPFKCKSIMTDPFCRNALRQQLGVVIFILNLI